MSWPSSSSSSLPLFVTKASSTSLQLSLPAQCISCEQELQVRALPAASSWAQARSICLRKGMICELRPEPGDRNSYTLTGLSPRTSYELRLLVNGRAEAAVAVQTGSTLLQAVGLFR
jgi:hypothetical protein